MIKIKTKYDYDENIFIIDKFILKDSCSYEFLALINTLIDEIIENDEFIDEKGVYKMIKDFRKAQKEDEIEVI